VGLTSERNTILDVLANCSDVSDQALRQHVTLFRENNGKREMYKLDLTSADIFQSPAFYVQQNDLIYVEPNKSQNVKSSAFSTFLGVGGSVISALASVTALVISILNNILRPILIVITLPATIVTLGFFLFIINAIIILMASEMVNGFHVDNFGSALLFSLVLMGVNYLLELPNKYLNRKNLQQPGSPTFTQTDNDTDDEGFTPYEEVE
jgi:uncharacterized membrane protein YvlD (DUF360 family)